MTQTYAWYDDGTMATQTYDYDTGGSNTLYTSTYTYDGLGRLQRTKIQDGRPRYIHFALASDGQILSRVMNQALTDDTQDYHVLVNGRQVGEYSDNVSNDPTNLGYDSSIAFHQSIAGTGDFRNGGTVGGMGAEMGSSTYDPVNPVTGGTGIATSSQYTVRSGDTLQGIAASLWGDSSLWYLIADANGLSADAMLTAGQALKVPFKGPSSANNASMFKPYDAAHATGDLAPTSPKPPKKNKCGALGQILLIAVVVAATIVLTAGAAAIAAGTTFGSAFGAVTGGTLATLGATATAAGTLAGGLGVAGAIGVAAIGGALGSIVGQGIGVATGLQDKFSWKGVALAGLSAGITQGVGGSGLFKGINSPVLKAAANGATSNALTQGIGVVTGLQPKFDWAAVAAAGIGAGVGRAVGGINGLSSLGKFGGRLVTNMAGGIANAASRSVINGSDFSDNVLAALPDIIGQTIGGAVADGVAAQLSPFDRTGANPLADAKEIARLKEYAAQHYSGVYRKDSPFNVVAANGSSVEQAALIKDALTYALDNLDQLPSDLRTSVGRILNFARGQKIIVEASGDYPLTTSFRDGKNIITVSPRVRSIADLVSGTNSSLMGAIVHEMQHLYDEHIVFHGNPRTKQQSYDTERRAYELEGRIDRALAFPASNILGNGAWKQEWQSDRNSTAWIRAYADYHAVETVRLQTRLPGSLSHLHRW